MSRVVHRKFQGSKEDFFKLVSDVMEESDWRKYVKGKVFVKINILSDQVVPGQCTSPWMVEAVFRKLKEMEVYAGDANIATGNQLEKGACLWNYKKLCKRYGVKFVNLSKQKLVELETNEEIFSKIKVPEILNDVDCIVTLPVLKTHNVTKMTFSMKNQWGCIPEFRHNYHLVADKCIAEINNILNVTFAVGDAMMCLEENGPRVGRPKIVNSVLASNDLVAIDSAGAKIIGIDPKEVGYIVNGEKKGIGRINFELVGDELVNEKFLPALVENHFIVNTELKMRKIKLFRKLIFETWFFKIPAFIASKYNSIYWYHLKGKRWAREIIKDNKFYKEQFGNLIR